MAKLDEHPTVRRVREQGATVVSDERLSVEELKQICLDAGADDVGFVEFNRSELDDQRDDIERYFPATKTLISFVCRMNREPIRSTARSVANLEFHHTGEHVNEVSRTIVARLEEQGVRAINPSMGFPMEMDRFPSKIWVVSHKPVAVAAGLGQMGIHRNVIHPVFGNFILLGTVLMDREVTEESQPIEYNPCLECRLCVAACPVGAIANDGGFNFSACFTHNYREFMSGYTDMNENIADSSSARQLREKVDDSESASMWQSLSFGANYKAAYCLAVCPAGEEVISPFLNNRGDFVTETLKPLQQKEEPIYVQPNTDAEDHVRKRFPHKTVRRVGNVLRPTSIEGFIHGMHHVFQPGRSKGLDVTYHFRFTGDEPADCTVTIRDQKIEVHDGHTGDCNLRVTTNSTHWVRFLRKEANIAWLLLTLRVRLRGDPRLLIAFGKCFP